MTLMNCRRSPVFRAGPGRGVSIEGTALVEYFSIREGGSPFLWLHDSKGIAPIFFERPLRARSRFGLGNLDCRKVDVVDSRRLLHAGQHAELVDAVERSEERVFSQRRAHTGVICD